MQKKIMTNEQSDNFSIHEWETHRLEYWQPIIYFPKNLDFNIAAKNGCSSIKGYFTYLKDPESLKRNFMPSEEDLEDADPKILEELSSPSASDRLYRFHYLVRRENRIKLWTNELTTTYKTFCRDKSHRVAIKRDPIKRFVSAYLQIWDESGFGTFKKHSYNIDELIDKLKSNEYWNEHTASQTFWMGNDPGFFNAVFDVTQTQDCINYMHSYLKQNGDAPKIHLMKNTYEKPELTRYQISKIEQLYLEDYENGWY